MRAYERKARPSIDVLLGRARQSLEQIRQLAGPSARNTAPAPEERGIASRELALIKPAPEMDAVHGLLQNAFQMAVRAADTRMSADRRTNDMSLAWQASSAAAGALLLLDRARDGAPAAHDSPVPVITPRTIRLLRVPDLQTLHATVARLSIAGYGTGEAEPRISDAGQPLRRIRSQHAVARCSCRRRGAAEALRRTLENRPGRDAGRGRGSAGHSDARRLLRASPSARCLTHHHCSPSSSAKCWSAAQRVTPANPARRRHFACARG